MNVLAVLHASYENKRLSMTIEALKAWGIQYQHIKHTHARFSVPEPKLIVGDSTAPDIHELVSACAPFDMVYVDGCHEYEYVKNDLLFYPNLVKGNGYLIIDDVSCYLREPYGFFSGIEQVSRATEEIIVAKPDIWKERLVVMHNRVFQRLS
jgi:hypothetical protein